MVLRWPISALGSKAESDAALAQMIKSQADNHPYFIGQEYMHFAASLIRRSNGSSVRMRRRTVAVFQ